MFIALVSNFKLLKMKQEVHFVISDTALKNITVITDKTTATKCFDTGNINIQIWQHKWYVFVYFSYLSPVKTRGYRVELVRLSVCLSVCPSVCLSVCLSRLI